MSKCDNCGRGDGHWIGCPATPTGDGEAPPAGAEMCAYDDCVFQRRPKTGKGPAPKYCTEHSDPKNRK
jgi:hypothetical protein